MSSKSAKSSIPASSISSQAENLDELLAEGGPHKTYDVRYLTLRKDNSILRSSRRPVAPIFEERERES